MATNNLWVLVLDASRARLVPGLPKAGVPAAPEIVIEIPAHKLGDIMADKPGRSFSSGSGGRRSSMEYGSDPVRDEMRAFAVRPSIWSRATAGRGIFNA